nr:MAG: heavy metal translocating P-type ATPase [Micrococcales bacterium]
MRRRVLICAALSVPVIVLAMVPAWQFTHWQWLSLTLTAPVVVWGGWPFHRSAWTNLRHGATTMDTLVSLGTLAAFGWSWYALFLGHAGMPGMTHEFSLRVRPSDGAGHIYLETAAGVTTFLLLGRYLEARAKSTAGQALRELMSLGVSTVSVLRDGPQGPVERTVSIDQLVVGDRFVVRPGERIATDGIVESGTSAVEQSMLTGESVPVDVGPGAHVTGATINTSGRLVVQATAVGTDTAVAQLARMVEQAQAGKAQVQRLADRISAVFVPAVIVLAAATLTSWAALGHGWTAAFTAAVAVLIIACPCALGLATPTALMVGTGRGAQLGIIISGPQVLESTRRVDTVVIDKTGTLTTGQMSVTDVWPLPGQDPDRLLRFAGSAEDASEHPIARAVVAHARDRSGGLLPVQSARSLPGNGVLATLRSGDEENTGGLEVLVGRPELFGNGPDDQNGWAGADELAALAAQARQEGTVVGVGWDRTARGVILVADTLRPTSPAALRDLTRLGLHPILLTGDHESTARLVAQRAGIDHVVAGVLPQQKQAEVARLQGQGRVVAMIGDGINDAAALAQADLGLAMGSGTDVAKHASDITLARSDLSSAVDAIRLARRTLAVIKGNLFWAFAYNVAALPLAALGLLNPMIAGAAMAFSSVFVVFNSLRLRKFTARRTDSAA